MTLLNKDFFDATYPDGIIPDSDLPNYELKFEVSVVDCSLEENIAYYGPDKTIDFEEYVVLTINDWYDHNAIHSWITNPSGLPDCAPYASDVNEVEEACSSSFSFSGSYVLKNTVGACYIIFDGRNIRNNYFPNKVKVTFEVLATGPYEVTVSS